MNDEFLTVLPIRRHVRVPLPQPVPLGPGAPAHANPVWSDPNPPGTNNPQGKFAGLSCDALPVWHVSVAKAIR